MKNAKKMMALGLAAVLLMGTISCSSDGGGSDDGYSSYISGSGTDSGSSGTQGSSSSGSNKDTGSSNKGFLSEGWYKMTTSYGGYSESNYFYFDADGELQRAGSDRQEYEHSNPAYESLKEGLDNFNKDDFESCSAPSWGGSSSSEGEAGSDEELKKKHAKDNNGLWTTIKWGAEYEPENITWIQGGSSYWTGFQFYKNVDDYVYEMKPVEKYEELTFEIEENDEWIEYGIGLSGTCPKDKIFKFNCTRKNIKTGETDRYVMEAKCLR